MRRSVLLLLWFFAVGFAWLVQSAKSTYAPVSDPKAMAAEITNPYRVVGLVPESESNRAVSELYLIGRPNR